MSYTIIFIVCFISIACPTTRSTPLPYTTLFRSLDRTPMPGEPNGAVNGGYAGLSARLAAAPVTMTVMSTEGPVTEDRKSTRLNSSHLVNSYAVFCLKKKNIKKHYANSWRILTQK